MVLRLIHATLLGVTLAASTPALAGDCRQLLHPLLLEAAPDPGELARIRTICQAEADAGDADSTYELALFSLGLAGNWQPDAALPLIRSAAARDVSEAQYWLAWQSESGPVLPHDQAVALDWYRKAAAGRHRLALQRLAEASERGELGLPVDPRQALAYRAQIRRCETENAQQRK
ncbi:MAG: hypothetical protein R3F24_06910 [Gammaproteobacteria bacterium]